MKWRGLQASQGAPNNDITEALCDESVRVLMPRWIASKRIRPLENASILVRMCDARRQREVEPLDPFDPNHAVRNSKW